MPAKKPTLLLLDANALLHRAWHALPPLTTKDGKVVHAAYGFAMVLDKLISQYQPTHMAAAWDLPGKTFRHEALASYKATRVKQPQELYDQIPICKEILEAYGVRSLEAPGYEADDIIGTVSALEGKEKFDTLIVTGDLDALQLVDENTHVLFFVKGVSETKEYDPPAVEERYGFDPERLIDYKALRGDTSDNVKGVPGIGEKTATELVKQFGTVEQMYVALQKAQKKGMPPEGMKDSLAQRLLTHEADARQSKMLVTIIRDVPLKFHLKDAARTLVQTDRLLEIFRTYEFRTMVRRLEKEVGGASDLKDVPKKHGSRIHISTILSQETATALATLHAQKIYLLAFAEAPDLFGGSGVSVAISDGEKGWMLPMADAHACGAILSFLGTVSELVTHDWKAVLHLLGAVKPLPKAHVFDTMIASYLLHSGSRAHDFPSVVSDMLKESFPEFPSHFSTDKERALVIRALLLLPLLAKHMHESLREMKMLELYENIEAPLIPVLYRMEQLGIALDVPFLQKLQKTFEKEMQRIEKRIHAASGAAFNLNSPSQLAEVLFEKLHLPTKGIKHTQTGYSTAASELEKLEDEHEIIPLVTEFRELAKLQSTYVESLPKQVDVAGRVHTTFNQAVTATGRLSSSDPNLQNIPIRTELGRELRKAFVAPRGRVLVSADYSQIELRLAAIIAKDKPFLEAFKEGADIHTRTAAMMFGVDEAGVSKEQRRAAKAINFGILYGMGPRALSRNAGISLADAKHYIERYFEIHHALACYIDEIKTKVRVDGYVETLLGRRRYLPEIHSHVPQLVAAAERMAVNMPIQGTEADILKEAMIAAQGYIDITYSRGEAILLLQVHDELVFEVEKKEVERFSHAMKKLMEGVAHFEIPLVVEIGYGKNWGETK